MRLYAKPTNSGQHSIMFYSHKSGESGDCEFFELSRDLSKTT